MTNLEYIKSLEAKEIADLFSYDGFACGMCKESCGNPCEGSCRDGIIAWLFAEHKKELKHCPFCGGELPKTIEYGDGWYVRCCECNAETDTKETEEEAIEAWNMRAE